MSTGARHDAIVVGDVAWGGNWFFITHHDGIPVRLDRVGELVRLTQAVQDALRAAGLARVDGGEIDHIEISAPAVRPVDRGSGCVEP